MCCTVTNYIFGSICCDFYEQLHSNHELIYRVMKKLLRSSYMISGFGVMGEVGNYRISNHAETSSPTNGLKNHVDYSSGTAFSTRFMPSIPENGDGNIGTSRAENGNNSRDYDSALLEDSWNVSPFNSMKRNRDGDLKMFSSFNGLLGNEVVLLVFLLVFMLFACTWYFDFWYSYLSNQNRETRNKDMRLTHHLSLPKTPSEIDSVEKFLQHDTIPCQIRAKRGCATHPRSIAERVKFLVIFVLILFIVLFITLSFTLMNKT